MVAMVTDIRCTHAADLDFTTNKQQKGSRPLGQLPFYIKEAYLTVKTSFRIGSAIGREADRKLTDMRFFDLMLVHEFEGKLVEFIGLLDIADVSAMLEDHELRVFSSAQVFR
ncbi:hypothetical protein METH109765_11280 [Mesobacillus thioparans]